MAIDYRMESLKNPIDFEGHGITVEGTGDLYLSIFENYNGSQENIRSAIVLRDIGTQMIDAAREGDYNEWSRLYSLAQLIMGKADAQAQRNIEVANQYNENALIIWERVSGGDISFEDLNFDNSGLPYYGEYSFLVFGAYYHDLYLNEQDPVTMYHIDSVTFLYHYLKNIVPLLLPILVLVVVFDSISEEWKNGSLKLILTQPFSRKKYLLSKAAVSTLHVLFIILFPVLIITLCLGVLNGFGNYNYPVMHLKDGFMSFETIPNYLEKDQVQYGGNFSVGISLYSHLTGSGISPKIGLTSLSLLLIQAFFLLILCVVFYVSVNLLVSSTTKNKVMCFSVAGTITIIGAVVGQRWVDGDQYNLSPFAMNNPVQILSGTYNTTAITAIAALSISTILILTVNIIYYQRKDL